MNRLKNLNCVESISSKIKKKIVTWPGDSPCQKPFLVFRDDFAVLGVNVDHAAKAFAVIENVHQIAVAQHQCVL